MTDREEFEKWWGEMNDVECYGEECHKRIAQVSWEKRGKIADAKMELAWQARGELDAVRIKELEMANKILIGMTDNMANQISEYEVIDKGQLERIKELESDLDDRKREVNLRCGQIQERDIRIVELTARIEKDREYALSIKKNLERLWEIEKSQEVDK